MGVDTIHINLAKPVDAVKPQVGVPNGQIKIRKCFGGFGLGMTVILLWFIAFSAISNQILML